MCIDDSAIFDDFDLDLNEDLTGEDSLTIHSGQEERQEGDCCICRGAVDAESLVVEMRPTGENEKLEPWPYCSPCWIDMLRLREREFHYRAFLNLTESADRYSKLEIPL